MVLFGVIVGLQAAENLIKSKQSNGILKVVIYACEESSRFGNACLGSKYLKGDLKEDDFDKIVDQKAADSGETISLRDAVSFARNYLLEHADGLDEVEKIFNEVDYSLEAHIEQYELLDKKSKKFLLFEQDVLGIVNSIGSAVRVRYTVKGQSGHTGSTPMRKRKNAVDAASLIGTSVRNIGRKFEKNGLGRASQVEISTPGHNGSFNQIPENAEGLIDFRLLGENTPEKVLETFGKIKRSAERKTKTKILAKVVSKGSPVITSASLNEGLAKVCDKDKIAYSIMPSFAGQDTGYIPAKEKTMIFIPSTGGSHNPNESTKRRFIDMATRVFTDFSRSLLVEKLRDRIAVDLSSMSSPISKNAAREHIVHSPSSKQLEEK